MRIRHGFVVASIALAAGCAAKVSGPSPQVLAELAGAEALFRNGCYTCLQEALVIFQKHARSQEVFNAALLIAIREQELGIPGNAAMARARSLALPASAPLLEAAALIAGETGGLDPEQRAQLFGRSRPALDPSDSRRRALDAAFDTDLTTAYVALTIDCEQTRLIENVDVKSLMAKYDGVPLMQFRLARCGRPVIVQPLQALRTSDPRWTDTLFWEARQALVGSPTTGIDFPTALALFNEGRAAFPTSLAMTMNWANVNLSAEEFAAALTGFDEVLATFPTHRDALIGRVNALSYLMRHQDAVVAATQVIDLGTWHIGDAYYWRAWNRYNLKEYETAWDDVENAIKGLSNTRVYTLAGMIAYARKELPTAIQRLDRAYEIDSSNCDATWMSGLANIDLEQLAIAAPKFTRAMSCFISSAAALRADRARLDQQIAARGTPASAMEQRRLDRSARDAENADERSAQSAFNAAQCLARTGNRSQALTHVDVALAHPRMREKALVLKAAIEKLPE